MQHSSVLNSDDISDDTSFLEKLNDKSNSYYELFTKIKRLEIVSYATVILSVIIFFMVIAIVAYTSSTVNAANKLIGDSSQTIKDLNEIIPDVKKSLQILNNLCKNYPQYCANS